MKKVLIVCTGNLDRSPTAAAVLTEMRAPMWVASAGTSPSAENQLTHELVHEADVICAMEDEHRDFIRRKFGEAIESKVIVLEVEDLYARGEARLKELLRGK